MSRECPGVIVILALFATPILFGAVSGYSQEEEEESMVDLSDSETFNPNSPQECSKKASEARTTCEEQARANNTDTGQLEEALKQCALHYGETVYLVCDCKRLQYLRCKDGPRAECNKNYYRCIVLAGYLEGMCLKSERPKQECTVDRWAAGKECERLERECVVKIPPKKPEILWR